MMRNLIEIIDMNIRCYVGILGSSYVQQDGLKSPKEGQHVQVKVGQSL